MNDGWTNTDSAEDFDTIDHRLIAVVERLIELTVASKVSWEHVSDVDLFAHSVNGASIQVYARDSDGRLPYVLELKNATGTVIEKFLTSETQGPVQQVLAGKVASLYTAARRDALQVGDVLDMLIAELALKMAEPAAEDDPGPEHTDDSGGSVVRRVA